jgi:hypothetical protein
MARKNMVDGLKLLYSPVDGTSGGYYATLRLLIIHIKKYIICNAKYPVRCSRCGASLHLKHTGEDNIQVGQNSRTDNNVNSFFFVYLYDSISNVSKSFVINAQCIDPTQHIFILQYS